MSKVYKYEGEEFEVSEPTDCHFSVKARGRDGSVALRGSGFYYATAVGSVTKHETLNGAVRAVCGRILHRESRPSEDELCQQMDDFYGNL